MSITKILMIYLPLSLLAGCATTECFKGDNLYSQNSSDCFRYCADPQCKYWGHSRDEAEEALNDARVEAKTKADKSCKSIGLKEGNADYGICVNNKLKEQNLLEYKLGVDQRIMTPNTYYFEK
jgi:hypothetical protein